MKKSIKRILVASAVMLSLASVSAHASYIYSYIDGSGIYREICFNDFWQQVPCSEL